MWACYCEAHKPKDIDAVLKQFNEQYQEILSEPLIIKQNRIRIKINQYKGDLPLVSLWLGVKGVTGYSACRYCFATGERIPGIEKNDISRSQRTKKNRLEL